MLSADRCHILSYLRLALCFYALADTDARHYGNLNHLQISPETYLTPPLPPTSTATITAVQIKPNYTLLLFLSDNKGGRWGWGRFNAIIEILLSFFLRGAARARRVVMDAGLSKCLLMMKRENPICSHKATSLQLC